MRFLLLFLFFEFYLVYRDEKEKTLYFILNKIQIIFNIYIYVYYLCARIYTYFFVKIFFMIFLKCSIFSYIYIYICVYIYLLNWSLLLYKKKSNNHAFNE